MTQYPDADVGPKAPRSLACLGNSQDIRTWSNIPYFLFKAARRTGFLTHALDLEDPGYRRRRTCWNALAPLRLERPGGYQWSRSAADLLWKHVPEESRHGEILSHFQVFPPLHRVLAAGMRHSFYCDATLGQFFDAGTPSALRPRVGRRSLADALAREGELYRAARFFIGMARATVQSAVRDYGVDPAKAFVVRAGANLDEDVVSAYLAQRGPAWRRQGCPFTATNPARLGFIGRDYLRKGLPRLVGAAEILSQRGHAVRVSVIGHCPEHLRVHPLVECVGLISKASDMLRFVEAVDRFALGCLPSYAEPLGIGTLEALRLGVPVMGTDVGGIPDCVPAGGGFLVPGDSSDLVIADAIEEYVFDADTYERLCEGAEQEMERVTWDATVAGLMQIWAEHPA